MIKSEKFLQKKILLIDQDAKKSNDRTWCFWEKEPKLFEPIVYRKWKKLGFHSKSYSKEFSTNPYTYKMIRGIDFYNYCFNHISKHNNITVLHEKLDGVFSTTDSTGVVVNGSSIFSTYVFNSILFDKPKLNAKQYWLLQHFKGWIIETEEDLFNSEAATFMDFRMDQKKGSAFCYVLPFSSRHALVEYTLFSKKILPEDQYDQGLTNYIRDVLKIKNYKIIDREFGIIPMTNYAFSSCNCNIVNIGTAGGQTKGSSGYTFNFIQKHSAAIVHQLEKTGNPFVTKSSRRFSFYDSVLLNILFNETVQGSEIFTHLFKKNLPEQVFRFLDNESSLKDEVNIISSLPVAPFLTAALKQLF